MTNNFDGQDPSRDLLFDDSDEDPSPYVSDDETPRPRHDEPDEERLPSPLPDRLPPPESEPIVLAEAIVVLLTTQKDENGNPQRVSLCRT